jgi:hypothetical protein
MAKKTKLTAPRSKKAGKPPRAFPASRQTKRRRVSATVAVKKDTVLKQTDAGTKVLWGANQRRPSKV